MNETSFPINHSASTGNIETIILNNDVLSFYQSEPDLSGNGWLCGDDTASGPLTEFNVRFEMTLSGSNGGSGVVKEIFDCGAGQVSQTCGSFNFSIK